jgi:hypothetical protein
MGFRFDRIIPHPVQKDNRKAAGIIQPNHGLVNFIESKRLLTLRKEQSLAARAYIHQLGTTLFGLGLSLVVF